MSKLDLWLIRHGECESNVGITSAKPHTSQLTAKGKEQAIEVATKIIKQPDLIISSPAQRAQDTAAPIIARWPEAAYEMWPIQELVYLHPEDYHRATPADKKIAVQAYWDRNDPEHCSGLGAESFAHFIQRVANFHDGLKSKTGFVVAVGHGMFFHAYQMCLRHGFEPTIELMKKFRAQETKKPIRNGEIIKIS